MTATYYRCQCGAREAWMSGAVLYDCQGCPICQTTFAVASTLHQPLIPHDYEDRYLDSPMSAPLTIRRCRRCGVTTDIPPVTVVDPLTTTIADPVAATPSVTDPTTTTTDPVVTDPTVYPEVLP